MSYQALYIAKMPNELMYRLRQHVNEINRMRLKGEKAASMSSVVQSLLEEYLGQAETATINREE